MPNKSTNGSSSQVSGNNGTRLYDQTHYDIDRSTIDISCQSGSCEVKLDEEIWYTWVSRIDTTLALGGRLNQTIDVDSSWYDGDHHLQVIATADNTQATVNFTSQDL